MNDTIPATGDQMTELMQFVDDHPEMDTDDLLDELYKRFPKEAVQAFTAAFTGTTPE